MGLLRSARCSTADQCGALGRQTAQQPEDSVTENTPYPPTEIDENSNNNWAPNPGTWPPDVRCVECVATAPQREVAL